MPKFIVTDEVACLVSFKYVIEAGSEDEAKEKYRNGDVESDVEPEIGDAVEGYGQRLTAKLETSDAK